MDEQDTTLEKLMEKAVKFEGILKNTSSPKLEHSLNLVNIRCFHCNTKKNIVTTRTRTINGKGNKTVKTIIQMGRTKNKLLIRNEII